MLYLGLKEELNGWIKNTENRIGIKRLILIGRNQVDYYIVFLPKVEYKARYLCID